jgi:hypothetical protein
MFVRGQAPITEQCGDAHVSVALVKSTRSVMTLLLACRSDLLRSNQSLL